MNQIKTSYGYDAQGNPIYLVGHIRYIVNDNGYTLDKILEDMAYVSDIEYINGRLNFPVLGNKDHLYIDTEKGLLYYWDEETSVYSSILAVDRDLVESKHTHNNISILNDIKYALTEELKNQCDSAFIHSQSDHSPADAQKNVNADWNAENGDAHILNKPSLGTIASRDSEEFATADQGAKADHAVQSLFIGEIEQEKLGDSIHIPAHQGAITSVLDTNLDTNKVVVSNHEGKLDISLIEAEELEHLSGINDNVQKQFDQTTTILQNEISRSTIREDQISNDLNNEISRSLNRETDLESSITEEVQRASEAENSISETIQTNKPVWDDKYTKNEIDNKFSALETATDWKESVNTFNDILTIYPEPEDGWTINVKDTNITYRYSGIEWIAISANAIPLATQEIDGLLSSSDKTNLDDMNIKKHTHTNKSVLDQVTQTFLDTVKPNVQSDWNTLDTFSDAFIKNKPTKLSDFDNDTAYIALSDIDTSENHSHTNKAIIDTITQEKKDSWDNAYMHSQTQHALSDAEKNIIDQISVNGDTILPDETRKVNITIPTKVSTLVNDSDFVTRNELTEIGVHSHSNKEILDHISAEKIREWNDSYANKGKASQLLNARKIGINNGASGTPTVFDNTSDINIPLTWIDANCISAVKGKSRNLLTDGEKNAIFNGYMNRLQFLPETGIKIEYSTDRGVTWIEDASSTAIKRKLVSGKFDGEVYSFNKSRQVRFTFTPVDRYCRFDTFYMRFSSQGATLRLKTERSTLGAKETFTLLTDSSTTVSGWPDHAVIHHNNGQFGGSSNQTGNFYAYRVTIIPVELGDTTTYPNISLYGFGWYGTDTFTGLSNHLLYLWDENKNTTFYGNITSQKDLIANSWVYSGGTFAYNLGTGANANIYMSSTVGGVSCKRYPIKFFDLAQYGVGVKIGDGGCTIVGAGESPDAIITALSINGGATESLILSSDNDMRLFVNCDTIGNRKELRVDSSLNVYPAANNTGSIGTNSYRWNAVHGTTLYESGTALTSKYAAKSREPRFLSNITVATSSFSNLVAKVTNSSIKANSIADVYFAKASIPIAQKAGIIVETFDGYMNLTAKKLPTANLTIETIKLVDK